MLVFIIFIVATALCTFASPIVKRWTQKSAACHSFYSDIYAEGQNVDLDKVLGGILPSEEAQVQFNFDFAATESPIPSRIGTAGLVNVSGTYTFYFEYCEPIQGNPKGVFQAIHGIVATAGYWNLEIDGKTDNSFAESAAAQGWSTLSYDRLGVRYTEHPDGSYNIAQIYLEANQAVAISEAIRNGYLDGVPAFNKVVAIGHSLGSQILSVLWTGAPQAFDAQVLTGFTTNQTIGPDGLPAFASEIASVAYPDRFGNLSNLYVITPSIWTDQLTFFHYPNFTKGALDLFTNTKGEYAWSQPLGSGGKQSNATMYIKPTFVVTGEYDGPFCQGNCYVTSLGSGKSQLDSVRPNVHMVADNDFATFVVPDTAHGINFHTTAYEAYQRILEFVEAHI